jgi:hypothetical protein
VFENRVLRIIFGSKGEVFKSRRMRWAGHVACMGVMMNAYTIWSEKLKGRKHLEQLDIHGKII